MLAQLQRPCHLHSILHSAPCGPTTRRLSLQGPVCNRRTKRLIRCSSPVQASSSVTLQEVNTKPVAPNGAGSASGNGASQMSAAEGCLRFINYAWTQFHAVEEASRRLASVGFQKLSEKQEWKLQPGGRYYFTRNLSTIVAFAVGAKYQPGNGLHMIGAHTDSPCLKLKPVSKSVKSNYLTVNCETYGGGLWHTWFDRDLSVAGRVLVQQGGKLQHKLVKIEKPIMRIPMLAIHLNRDILSEGFKMNKQTHLVPVLASAVKKAANKPAANAEADSLVDGQSKRQKVDGAGDAADQLPKTAKFEDKHHSGLLKMIADQLQCSPADIVDFELNVCDTQDGVIGGIEDEFMFTGRLDNLGMSYCSLAALLDCYPTEGHLADESAIKAIALFDHEEVGSASAQGAGGPVMHDTIHRVANILSKGQEGAVQRAIQNSFLVSADMAHAVHPNYSDKHDAEHAPLFQKGIVIKHNQNQKYATNAVTATLFRELAHKRGIPTQEFSIRNDMLCGSTIGPILASGIGCRTLDVGAPQLSMHSIREMCGTKDIEYSYEHFKAFFQDFTALDTNTDFDGLSPPNIQGTMIDTPCGHVH
ncbi:TPA: hypothetical protein ACH3X3_006599 [Trebouxia sp. C0006]